MTPIDLSHTIEHGMITYRGLPAPLICDYQNGVSVQILTKCLRTSGSTPSPKMVAPPRQTSHCVLSRLDRLPKVCAFIWKVGARFPHNGLGLESPATIQYERTFGRRSNLRIKKDAPIGSAIATLHADEPQLGAAQFPQVSAWEGWHEERVGEAFGAGSLGLVGGVG